MGQIVKHVLGVLEWSYVVPEQKFFLDNASLARVDKPRTLRLDSDI